MQVAGDAVTVIEHTHDADPVVEPGVLDRDAGGECEGLGQRLVLVGERSRTLLVGQIEVSVDLVSRPQRDAQERGHGRVPGRESIAGGMLFEMLETQWLGVGDQQSKHAPASGALADYFFIGFAEPDGDELLEPGAGLVEHPEGGVAGTDQRSGLLHQVREKVGQLDVGGDHQDGPHQATELFSVVYPRVGHRVERTADLQGFRGRSSGAGRMVV